MEAPGPESAILHRSSLVSSHSHQEGVHHGSAAHSVLGRLSGLLLISHVYSKFSPCSEHDAHANLSTHFARTGMCKLPPAPVSTWSSAAGTVWGGWGKFCMWVSGGRYYGNNGTGLGSYNPACFQPGPLPVGVTEREVGPSWPPRWSHQCHAFLVTHSETSPKI